MNRSSTKDRRAVKAIELRGVRVNNLKKIDLDITHGEWIAICGPSGSGKSSLVMGTIFSEGQRRYVETFSPYARQFMDQVERPAAEHLRGIPPAIGYVGRPVRYGRRATVASAIELLNHLQLLFTRVAEIICPRCQVAVTRDSASSIVRWIEDVPAGRRLQIGFPISDDERHSRLELQSAGFTRVLVGNELKSISEITDLSNGNPVVIVDRLTTSKFDRQRLLDSVTTVLDAGLGRCTVFVEQDQLAPLQKNQIMRVIAGSSWLERRFSRELVCQGCAERYFPPDPQRLSDSSPLGACPECEGLGSVSTYDIAKIVPNPKKSIREGAIAPWNSPSYEHELAELSELAPDYGIDLDASYQDLPETSRQLIWNGVPERKFGGLAGFFRWLEKRRYKMHLRIFAARWKSFNVCQSCNGRRWNEAALVYQVRGRRIADILDMSIAEAEAFFRGLIEDSELNPAGKLVAARLADMTGGLVELGLDSLKIGRPMRSLSGGEQQLLMIGRLLRSALVNLAYVFDEPTAGLHPDDAARLVSAIGKLATCGNTVIVADHSPQMLNAVGRVVELGPGAGELGGEVVFAGTPKQLASNRQSATGRFLKPLIRTDRNYRTPSKDKQISLRGCKGRNLQGIDVDFPLGLLTQVVGVCGSGKSTLVRDTLYRALANKFDGAEESPEPFEKIIGTDRIEGVVLVDDSPLTRTSRSNPATALKAYDLIRKLFSESEEAKRQNLKPGHFSFNVAGGRCEKCQGEGYLEVDMHFLADLRLLCDDCRGTRFRPNILKAKYRGKNIHEVLNLTAQQAFPFFRGQRKVQMAIKSMMDAGLGYLRLGQSLNTLSHGEERRLKLAQHLGGVARGKKMFVMLRPTTGLHHSEIARLVDCLDSLIAVGHSIVVVDNHPLLATYADWLIELGSSASTTGGELLFTGSPLEIQKSRQSAFAKWIPSHE
ncbi:MAG: excinuclease ABC subunit UvrA [Pirellulaceae bacterium]|nr:excinuclease ABC subunit UvrA [Pirellulaceae bacterium]